MDNTCPHLSKINDPPALSTRIYKDECSCCFKTSKDKDGLNICLHCFEGFCPYHFKKHYQKLGHSLYLHYKLVEKPEEDLSVVVNDAGEVSLANNIIGVQGGVNVRHNKRYSAQSTVYCCACAEFCGLKSFDLDPDTSEVCYLFLFNFCGDIGNYFWVLFF